MYNHKTDLDDKTLKGSEKSKQDNGSNMALDLKFGKEAVV